ncbi:MAG: hypothetical protein ACTSXP_16445 [Promethearchaeota archaeon]
MENKRGIFLASIHASIGTVASIAPPTSRGLIHYLLILLCYQQLHNLKKHGSSRQTRERALLDSG